jgi:ABC-type lipoprotein export system ATPase subunit
MTDSLPVQLSRVTKTYPLQGGDFTAFDRISRDFGEKEFIAIMGPSGSGKLALMKQLGILLTLDPMITEYAACLPLRLVDGRIAES